MRRCGVGNFHSRREYGVGGGGGGGGGQLVRVRVFPGVAGERQSPVSLVVCVGWWYCVGVAQ